LTAEEEAKGEAWKGRGTRISDGTAAGLNSSPGFVLQKREDGLRVSAMDPELSEQTDGPSRGLMRHQVGGKKKKKKKKKKKPWLLSICCCEIFGQIKR
jgi:hypothetical protein